MSREDCLCLRTKGSNRGSLQVGRALVCVIAGGTLLLWAASQARGDQITRGPYLQLQTPDAISVVWWTDATCTGAVEWGSTTSYGNLAQAAQPGTRHEIAITGLSPDTLYHYRVRCGGALLGGDATFRTAPPADATAVSFTFVGDSPSLPSMIQGSS